MPLTALLVLHRRKDANVSCLDVGDDAALHLETCLREVCIGHRGTAQVLARCESGAGLDRFQGMRAYEFLLRIGCGLDSAIRGESDVFGQLREAWRRFEQSQPEPAGELRPLMQRLFEDIKEIRSRHLRSLGTVTYGGLVRRLLGEHSTAPTLLIGAGHMARAVLPYLNAQTLEVWNRDPARIGTLLSELGRDRAATVRVLPTGQAAELDGWRRAVNVILCIPQDAAHDAARLIEWHARSDARGRLIHLGLLSSAGTVWDGAAQLATLSDLFALQAEHNALREAQLARAGAACREKARLRSLGGPLSLAHGWEDLSLFASAG